MSDLLLGVERESRGEREPPPGREGSRHWHRGQYLGPSGDLIAVTPTGADLGTVTAEMVTVIDLGGQVVDGDLAPTSEVPLHTGSTLPPMPWP